MLVLPLVENHLLLSVAAWGNWLLLFCSISLLLLNHQAATLANVMFLCAASWQDSSPLRCEVFQTDMIPWIGSWWEVRHNPGQSCQMLYWYLLWLHVWHHVCGTGFLRTSRCNEVKCWPCPNMWPQQEEENTTSAGRDSSFTVKWIKCLKVGGLFFFTLCLKHLTAAQTVQDHLLWSATQ